METNSGYNRFKVKRFGYHIVIINEIIESLEGLMQEQIARLPSRRRAWMAEYHILGDRGIMVTGPRGVGKTTFLLQ